MLLYQPNFISAIKTTTCVAMYNYNYNDLDLQGCIATTEAMF